MQKAIRLLLILVLALLVFWALGHNTKKQQRHGTAQWAPIVDTTQTLTPAMVRQLETYAEQFKKTYGTALYIRIHENRLNPFPSKENTIYLDICPATQEISFFAPPLVMAALGHELTTQLCGPKFPLWFLGTPWPQALSTTLNRITTQLDAALLQQLPQGTPPTP